MADRGTQADRDIREPSDTVGTASEAPAIFEIDARINLEAAPRVRDDLIAWLARAPAGGALAIMLHDPDDAIAIQLALAARKSGARRSIGLAIVDGDGARLPIAEAVL